MPRPRRAPRAAALIFGITACICAACGSPSTGPVLPTLVARDPGIEAANLEWSDWKQGPGKFLDRDFYDCYELNNIPIPVATPLPDPSGHSRGRRFCAEAISAVVAALPDYQRFADNVKDLKPPAEAQIQGQYDALLKARATRLDWAQNVASASQANDQARLRTLQLQIPAIDKIESLALGVDLSNVTPPPRPTLSYIPGVPTSTPARR